jgi:hypothetical protein
MNKFALAALAVATITATVVPALAQSNCRIRCGYERSVDNCGELLGVMKRVYPAQVQGIDNTDRVWVTEFCPSSDILSSDGNAAYLRTTIAQNDVLVAELFEEGYRPEDVVAVRMMGDDTINLYVHRFDTSASLIGGGGGHRRTVNVLR